MSRHSQAEKTSAEIRRIHTQRPSAVHEKWKKSKNAQGPAEPQNRSFRLQLLDKNPQRTFLLTKKPNGGLGGVRLMESTGLRAKPE
ncbi:hypothetical protein SRHO_G00131080 [Serrasalmus rhombeus]